MRVAIKPSLLRWACDRSGRSNAYYHHRFPQLATWLNEAAQTTFKQLQDFSAKLSAIKTHKKGLMQQLFPSPEEE